MTTSAATRRVDCVDPIGDVAIPAGSKLDLATSQAPYRFWLMAKDSTGYGVAVTAIPNLMGWGAADADVPTAGASAGAADVPVRHQWFVGYRNSDAHASDTFALTDGGKVAWGANNQTIGKLSNYSGANRSMVGVFVELRKDQLGQVRTVLWGGFDGWMAARGAHIADTVLFGQHSYLVDAGAATDLTEIQFSQARAKLHGTIASIEFIANATLAATGGTDYKTLTVTKYAADGSTPVVVGTMTTVLVTTKWVAKAFTLSAVAGALDILEGDTFTIQNSHGGSGATTPAGVIRINGKVG